MNPEATATVGQAWNSWKWSPPKVSARAPAAHRLAESMQKVMTKVKKSFLNALAMWSAAPAACG